MAIGNFTQRDLGGNVLICWDATKMASLVAEFGVASPSPEPVPTNSSVIWTLSAPYKQISIVTSEACAGLDVPAAMAVGNEGDGIGAAQPPPSIVPGIGAASVTVCFYYTSRVMFSLLIRTLARCSASWTDGYWNARTTSDWRTSSP